MSYDLRRLRLHGLIRRIHRTRRYQVTQEGFKSALFLTRCYNRMIRPGLSALSPSGPPAFIPLVKTLDRLDRDIQRAWEAQQLAA